MSIDHIDTSGSPQPPHRRGGAERHQPAVELLQDAGHAQVAWPMNLDALLDLVYRRDGTKGGPKRRISPCNGNHGSGETTVSGSWRRRETSVRG